MTSKIRHHGFSRPRRAGERCVLLRVRSNPEVGVGVTPSMAHPYALTAGKAHEVAHVLDSTEGQTQKTGQAPCPCPGRDSPGASAQKDTED